jgi:two-component system, cell cycle response regulator
LNVIAVTQLTALTEALARKDVGTAAHSIQVAELAERVGARLGMYSQELRALRWAALLHDVGKIDVSTSILNKPGALSEAEFDEIRQHTIVGARMVGRIPFFSRVHPLVRWSHERWDGGGYPDGLAGPAIPLGARVICACDAFDAMVSERPYRAAIEVAAALAELRAGAGSQFDPEVVAALVAEVEGSALADARIA